MIATNCNPPEPLGSILRRFQVSPNAKICAALALRSDGQESQASMSRALGYHRVYLSRVINGHIDSPPARRKIADYLGVAQEDIWPAEAA